MKKIIALALSILLGSTGYVIVDHTIEDRVGVLESQVESLNSVVSSLEDKHTLKYDPIFTTTNNASSTQKQTTTSSNTSSKFTASDVQDLDDYIASNSNLNDIDWYIDKEGSVTTEGDKGVLGFGYSTKDKCFYATGYAWQRDFGYNELYDKTSQLIAISYDTINVYFDYKDSRGRPMEWMIQFWKGQYGMVLVGAEIGVYNRTVSAGSTDTGLNHYNAVADSDMLPISLNLYQNNKLLFSRAQKKSWWQTGFVPGQLGVTSGVLVGSTFTNDLKVTTNITLKDEGMAAAFVEGLNAVTRIFNNVDAMNAQDTNAGYRTFSFREGDGVTPGTYSVSGDTVKLTWQ